MTRPEDTQSETTRCAWAANDAFLISYHDHEWGVPLHDDRALFEFLVLEGAQAGLSWLTILRKRPAYRIAFDDFDPHKVAGYSEAKVAELLANAGIVRNRLKIGAAVRNAQAFLAVQDEFGSFDTYIWQFVNGRPLLNKWKGMEYVPARTPQSDAMSKELVKRGSPSWARLSVMRSCRQSGWSTITWWSASGERNWFDANGQVRTLPMNLSSRSRPRSSSVIEVA